MLSWEKYNFCSIVVTAPCYECNDVPPLTTQKPYMKRLFGLLSVRFTVSSTDLKSR